MSIKTNIEWADSTGSPWYGCTVKSPGCEHCFARELTLRYGWAGWGNDAPRVRSKGFGHWWDSILSEDQDELLLDWMAAVDSL